MKKILILIFLVSFLFVCKAKEPIYSGKVISIKYIDSSILESDIWLIKFDNESQVNAVASLSDIIEIGKIYNVFKGYRLFRGNCYYVKKKK